MRVSFIIGQVRRTRPRAIPLAIIPRQNQLRGFHEYDIPLACIPEWELSYMKQKCWCPDPASSCYLRTTNLIFKFTNLHENSEVGEIIASTDDLVILWFHQWTSFSWPRAVHCRPKDRVQGWTCDIWTSHCIFVNYGKSKGLFTWEDSNMLQFQTGVAIWHRVALPLWLLLFISHL